MSADAVVLIPAYNPDMRLADLVEALAQDGFSKILVIDDGSCAEAFPVFDRIRSSSLAEVIVHERNKGKGAALKTGLAHIAEKHPACLGAVTADADGQHTPKDVRKVAEALAANPGALVLGARKFDKDVPFRSMFGNKLTSLLMDVFLGMKVSDTQTGLRGIPLSFAPALAKIFADRYEFELEMLLKARALGVKTVEVEIETIYLEGNASSHFDPIHDSAKIYYVLFRHLLAALGLWALDLVLFSVAMFAMIIMSSLPDLFEKFLSRPGAIVALVFCGTFIARCVDLFLWQFFITRRLRQCAVWLFATGIFSAAFISCGFLWSPVPALALKILAEALVILAWLLYKREERHFKRG